jgi:REP element-mobilizing transposase RayT
MKYDLDKGSHSVYLLQYHLVQGIKYRKKNIY